MCIRDRYYQPGDTLPGKTNAGLMGAAEEKLVPQIEQMLPKMDSILYLSLIHI